MGIGAKLRQAITSSFIEVRRDDAEAQAAPTPVVVPEPELAPKSEVAVATPEPESVPEPVIPTEREPLTPPDLNAALNTDGSLNDSIVYRGATLAQVPFTAEQAIDVLVELPSGVTSHRRCQAMQEAIAVVTDDLSNVGHLVVSDAAQKMVSLNLHLNRSREELKAFRRSVAEEMDRLHEQLNRLRILVDETNANYNALDEAGRERVDNLTGVIAFFDEFQAYLRSEESAAEGGGAELPAYLRDDTARKLLGMGQEKDAA